MAVDISRGRGTFRAKNILGRSFEERERFGDSHFWDGCQDFCLQERKMTERSRPFGKGTFLFHFYSTFPFLFFTRPLFFLSTWSLISLVSKVRIPEENFFLRSPPRYLVSCLQRSRLSTLLNLNESFLTFILEIIVISTRVSIRQHMLERRKERKKERSPSSNKLVSNEWEELEDETRHPSKFSLRVSRLGVEWNSNRREPFPWN